MRFPKLLIILTIANFGAMSLPSSAVQFPDGTVTFDSSPRIVNVTSTFKAIRIYGAKYYFTIELPPNVGESLQQINIEQRQGEENIGFTLDETMAFMGGPNNKGEEINIGSVIHDPEKNVISIIFSSPIPPGNTFTVGLKPRRNPQFAGTYLFGITAFPTGEKPRGLYLGVGRLQFYDGRDSIF